MAITDHRHRLEEARKPGFGIGLLKGMRVLLKHLFKHNTVIEYPKVKQDLSSRSHRTKGRELHRLHALR
jgi:formate hydrogenlyase subunit 6/NADH:ubiquinone oxidoreductase subunit I